MAKTKNKTRGADLAKRLWDGRKQAQNAPVPGARDIKILRGLNPNCTSEGPFENVMAKAQDFLVDSGRVYRYGNSVVIEVSAASERRLATLMTGSDLDPAAASLLANLFLCECEVGHGDMIQFVPPAKFVAALLHREPTRTALPEIRLYAKRPVFDTDFLLRGPGWHADVGILVHDFDIEPSISESVDESLPAMDRLPPHMYELLRDFCFKEDADVANIVAVLITSLLVTRFIRDGKPVVLLDGNQPGLGKTLLVRIIGIVLDGVDPKIIHYTADDEELQKRICATLRGSSQSQLLIDNAKTKTETAIHSAALEANSVAAEVSLRILGKSENYTRPNDVLWYVTMNNTKSSPDLVSRGLPVRQFYEGNPRTRKFGKRNPLKYAQEHRQEILGELVGMVVRWNQLGRPDGEQQHRLTEWARIIGGIMTINGFPEFLTNLDTAAADFNTALDMLAALAEAAISAKSNVIVYLNQETESSEQ
jgi:hypothetical protein